MKDDEIDALFRRVDIEADGVVSYGEFLEFVIPFNIPDKQNFHNTIIEEIQIKPDDSIIEENKQNNEKSQKIESLGERLIQILFAARAEENNKQELSMFSNFSATSAMQTIATDHKNSLTHDTLDGPKPETEANPKLTGTELSEFLKVPLEDAKFLLNDETLSESKLLTLLTPFNENYKCLISLSNPGHWSIPYQNCLKSTLISTISTEKQKKSFL